jgi:hypothetical protein
MSFSTLYYGIRTRRLQVFGDTEGAFADDALKDAIQESIARLKGKCQAGE